MTRPATAVLAGLAAAALVAAVASPAFAHAAYKDSDPAKGATVASPPSRVTAEFTEPITNSSYLEVFDPCGNQVDNGDSRVGGYEMSITMSGDFAGEYTVEFAAQSVDTHVTYGSFSFTSSGGGACPGAEPAGRRSGGRGGGGGGGGSGGGSSDPGPAPGSGSSGGDGGGTASAPGAESGGTSAGGGGAGRSGRSKNRGGGNGGGGTRAGSGPRSDDPVAFEPAGDTAPREPRPWDLPVGGAVMALVLCVMIGAAGGRVYAGIVAPPRR